MSVTDQIKAAKTKDDLEKIAKDEFQKDVDKRRGLETIRADVLLMAEGGEEGADQEAPAENAGRPAEDNPGDTRPGEPQVNTRTDATEQEKAKAMTAQERAEARRQAALKRPTEKRRLKNTRNGRVFVYTADLAKKAGMVEVTGEE